MRNSFFEVCHSCSSFNVVTVTSGVNSNILATIKIRGCSVLPFARMDTIIYAYNKVNGTVIQTNSKPKGPEVGSFYIDN